MPLLVFGLLLIALPTFVLGREFSIVWDLMKEHENQVSARSVCVHAHPQLTADGRLARKRTRRNSTSRRPWRLRWCGKQGLAGRRGTSAWTRWRRKR